MLSVMDQVVTLLTCISEVPSSILTRDTLLRFSWYFVNHSRHIRQVLYLLKCKIWFLP